MKLHGRVFWILGMMQWVWYRSDGLRERFVSMHVLVPGDWTVQRGHDLLEEVEEEAVLMLQLRIM